MTALGKRNRRSFTVHPFYMLCNEIWTQTLKWFPSIEYCRRNKPSDLKNIVGTFYLCRALHLRRIRERGCVGKDTGQKTVEENPQHLETWKCSTWEDSETRCSPNTGQTSANFPVSWANTGLPSHDNFLAQNALCFFFFAAGPLITNCILIYDANLPF